MGRRGPRSLGRQSARQRRRRHDGDPAARPRAPATQDCGRRGRAAGTHRARKLPAAWLGTLGRLRRVGRREDDAPLLGLIGFSYPLVFGVLSIGLSFGKGLLFFMPGLLLPLTGPLREVRWAFLVYLAGICYCSTRSGGRGTAAGSGDRASSQSARPWRASRWRKPSPHDGARRCSCSLRPSLCGRRGCR